MQISDQLIESLMIAARGIGWDKGVTVSEAEIARQHTRQVLEAALSAAEPVGEVGEMPGSNGGFTMAAFKAADVPIGAKLYTAPPAPSVAVKAEDFARQLWGYFKGDSTGGTTAMQWFDNNKSLGGPARLIELCRSALSAQVQDVAGWKPIETAPKDGRVIDLLQDDVEYRDHEWFEGAWCMVFYDQSGPYVAQRLTHPKSWRPRTAPAKQEGGE